MKKAILILLSFILIGCFRYEWDPLIEPSVSKYEPITIKRSEIDKSIKVIEVQEITKSAKIYIIDEYIFITDQYKGFHIFSNSNPKNPVKKKFLKVPGATDVAIRKISESEYTLFINQATDLVSISFNSKDLTIKLDKRIENVLTPNNRTPDGCKFFAEDPENEVIVGWKLKK